MDITSFRSCQMSESSCVSCTIRITDQNEARRIAHANITHDDFYHILGFCSRFYASTSRARTSLMLGSRRWAIIASAFHRIILTPLVHQFASCVVS